MNDKLVAIFKEADGFVSGEHISRELGISRTAVWKRIRRLQEAGYVFESVPRLGYRLLRVPQRISPEKLLPLLTGTPFGSSLRVLETTDSTQNVAHEMMLNGAGEGCLVVADSQSAGRGRLGRSWFSPPGTGIYMSFLLQPDIPPTRAAQITLLLSVAMCRTLRKETGLPAEIKWPNDILIRGRKVCGILIETILEADRVKMMIAGIGMNVNTVRSEFPADLSDSVTSLMEEAGRMFSREELIGAFFEQLAHLYDLFRSEGFAPIKTLWEALTVTLGKRVRVAGPHGLVEGIAENITDEGALMVRDDNGRLTALYSGDLAAAPRG